jgi:hypothetical protein
LAALYGETKRFNEQVKRNAARFPTDFMFQLTTDESDFLRSQIATLKPGRGQHRKYLPYAFTEHGAIMAAMVLNSPRAVEVSVYVVRAFVRLREAAVLHKDLADRLTSLEEKSEALAMSHDTFSRNTRNQLRQVFDALQELTYLPTRRSGLSALCILKRRRTSPQANRLTSPAKRFEKNCAAHRKVRCGLQELGGLA